jgi:cystathionine beta-lyase/cystathionine gamma-synthase
LYASDPSSRSGAFTWTEVGEHEAKNFWRHADKKGTYTKLDSPVRSLLEELVPETDLAEDFVSVGPF